MDVIKIKAYTTDSTHLKAIKAFMKTLKIKFEVSKEMKSPYDPEFVAKIKKGDQEFSEGKGIKVSVADFKELCK